MRSPAAMNSGIANNANESTVEIMLCAAGMTVVAETNIAIIDPPRSASAIGTSIRSRIRNAPIKMPKIIAGLLCGGRLSRGEELKGELCRLIEDPGSAAHWRTLDRAPQLRATE